MGTHDSLKFVGEKIWFEKEMMILQLFYPCFDLDLKQQLQIICLKYEDRPTFIEHL